MAGKYRVPNLNTTPEKILLRIPGALKAHLSDAADQHKRSLNEEIVERLMRPRSRSELLTNAYEGTYSVDTLLLRTEPEDAGPRIELWRALRDVSRGWLAHQLAMNERLLRSWERSDAVTVEQEKVIQKQLDSVDERFPELPAMAARRLEEAQGRMRAKGKVETDGTEIDWLKGSSTYDN